jgi:cytochrome c oxidase subunit 4
MSHIASRILYVGIFAALMVLTGITIVVAFIDLGVLNFTVAISIAIIKATLVILFFMHALYSSRLTKLIIGTGFFFLLVLFVLTLTDYASRGWETAPPQTANTISNR